MGLTLNISKYYAFCLFIDSTLSHLTRMTLKHRVLQSFLKSKDDNFDYAWFQNMEVPLLTLITLLLSKLKALRLMQIQVLTLTK